MKSQEYQSDGPHAPISHYCDAVRWEVFGEARPASTLIGVKERAIPGMKIEIEAVVGLR